MGKSDQISNNSIVLEGLYTKGRSLKTLSGKEYIGEYHLHQDGVMCFGSCSNNDTMKISDRKPLRYIKSTINKSGQRSTRQGDTGGSRDSLTKVDWLGEPFDWTYEQHYPTGVTCDEVVDRGKVRWYVLPSERNPGDNCYEPTSHFCLDSHLLPGGPGCHYDCDYDNIDCDNDNECLPGLYCGVDNCSFGGVNGITDQADCCAGQPSSTGYWGGDGCILISEVHWNPSEHLQGDDVEWEFIEITNICNSYILQHVFSVSKVY